jgi:phospholipid/cholesterol/gamma-HCH transport system substrate-binding protein
MSLTRRLAIPVVIVVLLAAAAITMLQEDDTKKLTAHFPRTVSLYEGSEVRILGVPVGTVDTVTPSGTDVVVTMSYEPDVKLPSDAKAVIVAPSIVGDRYVQLTPAYSGGAQLADGATLETDRTAVPLELDQIYSSLDQLTVALGPNGANRTGALTDLLEQTAKNFGGQGASFNRTIRDFSQLTTTLDDNKDELFGSARELQGFLQTLANNDTTVRQFNSSLSDVSNLLADEREELAAALKNLGTGLDQVTTFVQDNREILGKNIKDINRVAKVLVKQRDSLAEVLKTAPVALNNLALTYNPQAGTLDVNANLGELVNQITSKPSELLCSIVNQADDSGQLCDLVDQVLPRSAPFGTGSSYDVPFDQTLGGLVPAGPGTTGKGAER